MQSYFLISKGKTIKINQEKKKIQGGGGVCFLKSLSVKKDASSSLLDKRLSQKEPFAGVWPAPSHPPAGQKKREQPTGAFLFIFETLDKISYSL